LRLVFASLPTMPCTSWRCCGSFFNSLLHKGHGKLLRFGFFDVFFVDVVAFDDIVGSDVCVLFGSPA